MKDLKEMIAQIKVKVPKKRNSSTHRTVYGYPWFTSETGMDVPINIVSEDEMRKSGLREANRRAQERRWQLNTAFGVKGECNTYLTPRRRKEVDSEHIQALETYHERLIADAAAKKAYEIKREQKTHNTWLTPPVVDQ